MDSGWVKLHRKITDSRVFQNDGLFKVWIWCLCRASHKKEWVILKTGKGNIEVEVEPGQFVFGRNSASKNLRMPPSSIRNRMEKLKNIGNLDIKQDNQYSLITIINWHTYQVIENKEDRKEDKQRTGKGQAKDTYKNDKNDKNDIKHIVEFMNSILETEYKTTTAKTNQLIHARLNEGFTVENFKTVILKKHKEWRYNPDMVKFLRPETLFGVKFESYLNQHENNPEKEKLKKIQTATEYLTEKEMERKSV